MRVELAEEISGLSGRLGFHREGWTRTLFIYVFLIGIFGVFVPFQKGRDFLSDVILGAYACLGVVFAAPAAAPEFEKHPTTRRAMARIAIAVLYGELVAGAMLLLGVITVYTSHGGRVVVGPNLSSLAECAALGLTLSLAVSTAAVWISIQASPSAAKGVVRLVFFGLLAAFYLRSGWLPAVALRAGGIALLASALFFSGSASILGKAGPQRMNGVAVPDKQGLLLRVGLYMLLAWLGLLLFAVVIQPLGIVVTATLSTFAAAAVANAVVVRVYERGRLADVGLGASPSSGREFLTGAASGAAAVVCVILVPVALGMADFQRAPAAVEHPGASLAFGGVAIFFGAMGEELLFRGYAFQLLIRSLGPFATILPTSVIFGLMHAWNPNATTLGIVNTVAWGILLGFAVWRTGALWLPIGLHFGWNVSLPLLGSNLSGFTMGVTGYTLQWSVGVLWSGGSYGVEGSLLTTGIVVALFFALRKLIPQAEKTE